MCSFICSFIFAQFSFLYIGSDKLKLLTVSSLKEAKVTGSSFSEPESNDVMNLASDRGNHNSQDALEITVATGRGKGSWDWREKQSETEVLLKCFTLQNIIEQTTAWNVLWRFYTAKREKQTDPCVSFGDKAKIPSPLQFNRATASPLVSLTAGFSRVSDVPTT